MEVIRDTSLAGSLGSILGAGLGQLAKHKMDQMQQVKKAQSYMSAGIPPNIAASLPQWPEKAQTEYLMDFISRGGAEGQQYQQQQTGGTLQNGLAALQGMSAAAPSQEAAISQPRPDIASIPSAKLPTARESAQAFTQGMGVGQGQNVLNQAMQQAQPQQPQQQEQVSPMQNATQQISNELAQKKGGRPEGWRPLTFKEKAALRKENKPIVDEIFNKKEGAKTTKMTIGRMQKLNREGKLIDPTAYAVLKKAGWDIPGLMTADTQEFKKLEQVFLQHMKDIFGSRISITEMEQFIQGIPSLMQTPEGRERVFRNFSLLADIDEEKARVFKDIERQYGYQPDNLRSIIDTQMDPYLEQKTKEFIEGAERPMFKPGDKIDIHKIPAFTVPGMRATQDGKKWISDGAQWKERE